MWKFKKGLSPEFVLALGELAKKPSWFRDVLLDRNLIIGTRDDHLNVYLDGQSLFKVVWHPSAKTMSMSTHPKYLVDPAMSKPVSFDGQVFCLPPMNPLAKLYEVGKTLQKMKKASKAYSGIEKQGVHKVFRATANAVDLEIVLNKSADNEKAKEDFDSDDHSIVHAAGRVDLACFQKLEDKICLCFWEAKDYQNADLWAPQSAVPPVVKQVLAYQRLIDDQALEIAHSYQIVTRNLVSLAKMAGREDELGGLITRVSEGDDFFVGPKAKVGVLIFGFSAADEKGDRHKQMIKQLNACGLVTVAEGDPAKTKLEWCEPPRSTNVAYIA